MKDLVSRIMRSKASRSAPCASCGHTPPSDHEDQLESLADGQPNEFDVLELDKPAEFSYTGANSGDELGNEQEESDRSMVKRIMSKRAKTRMPSPK